MLRYIIIALSCVAALSGCQHTPPEYVSRYTPAPSTTQPPPGPAAVAIIGGSYTAGTEFGGMGRNGWPSLVATHLGQQGIDIIPSVGAENGSGYITPGDDGTVFADQIPVMVRPDDQLVVIFGSRSESDTSTEEFQAGVRRTLDAARAAAPNAKIIVIGPVWTEPDPPKSALQSRDVVQTEAGLTGGATFVDPIAEGWFRDHPELIGSDGVHPTDAGHAYMADKITPLIAAQLRSP